MALKAMVESIDEVPEALREHYVEDNGVYILDSDATERVKEFRTNNINLIKERDAFKSKIEQYDGIDPEKYRELAELEQKKRDKELIEKGEFQTLLDEKLKDVNSHWEQRLEEVTGKLESTTKDLYSTKVVDKLKSAAANAGVLPNALDTAVKVVSGDWELKNGDAVRADGVDQSMDDYFADFRKRAPYFFAQSAGGGGRTTTTPSGTIREVPNDPIEIGKYADEINDGRAVVVGR